MIRAVVDFALNNRVIILGTRDSPASLGSDLVS